MAVKKKLSTMLALAAMACLSACAVDLGEFEKGDGYKSLYDSLGDVDALYDGGKETYDVEESLFNAKTVQEFKWEKEEYEVKQHQYLYIIIPFEKELRLENIALYAYTPVRVLLHLSVFFYEDPAEAPQKIKYLSSPDTKPIYDDDGNVIGEEPIEYDDPPVEEAILTGDVDLAREEWTSFVMANFKQPGYSDGYLHTVTDGLLYIRAENNSGFHRDDMTPITYSFVNLIMRSVA